MKLTKLQVENFKCIHDSTPFELGDITCLVGKNESGKTALLEAFYKIKPVENDKGEFDLLEYPRMHTSEYKERHEDDPDNVITLTCQLDDDDVAAVKDVVGVDPFISREIILAKGYNNVRRHTMEIDQEKIASHFIKNMNFNAAEIQQTKGIITIHALIERLTEIGERTPKQGDLLEELQNIFPESDADQAIRNVIAEQLPTMVLFTDYYRLQGKVSMNELRKKMQGEHGGLKTEDNVFLALLDLASSNVEELEGIDTSEHVIMELEAIGNRLTDEIFEYWTTNKHLHVVFRYDEAKPADPHPFNNGKVFNTRIYNNRHRVTVPFDERSSGFIWFFSFLVWFSQVKKTYGENLVILLDEPGLTLHGKAQADLLRYINEKLRTKYQVIYTTHSPFMVDPENILAVRTVEDIEEDGKILGTKVGDKALSTDRDTILPLQGALGYDITQTLFVGPNTIVVEGPSDLLYLKWFSTELKRLKRKSLDPRWTISPIGGITKIGSFVALLYGQTKKVAVLTDYATGGKSEVQKLQNNELLKDGHVLTAETYANQSEADLEDVIGRDNYITIVNDCYGFTGTKKLPEKKDMDAPERVVKEVENHFRILSPADPEFDHYEPATHLVENGSTLRDSLPDLDSALNRFEKLIEDLNALL